MDSVCVFESKDGQMVSLQSIYGLCLQVSTMADCANSNFCSVLIFAVVGLFGLIYSCLGDRANC